MSNNPIFNMFGNMMNGNMMGGIGGLMQQFQQFRQTFRGDPNQQIQQLLNSGKISQMQYNQAMQMAQVFQNMIGHK